MRGLALLILVLLAAGCGHRGPLVPPDGSGPPSEAGAEAGRGAD